MKPETLTLINVGPFPGRHDIDFSSLGEIFLIFGKTGAGKTTIFDSIAYALYGELPGSRKGLVKQMRSQFALDEEASSVTLVFTIGSRKYRATRVLPGERIGKRTGKVQQTAEESSLDEWDKGSWAARSSTNKSETDERIRSLIGLSEEEFSRIVLLPQGEFAQFLRQNSAQRKQILAKLFPIEAHARVIELARERAREAEALLEQSERAILSLRERFNPADYEDRRAVFAREAEGAAGRLASLRKESARLASEIERAKAHRERSLQRERIERNVVELTSREGEMNERQRTVELSRAARPLALALTSIEALRAKLDKSRAEADEAEKGLELAKAESDRLDGERAAMEGLAREREALLVRKERLELAVKIAVDLSADREQAERARARKKELVASAGEREKALSRLTAEAEALSLETSLLEGRMEEASKAREELERARALKTLCDEYAKESRALAGHRGALEAFEKNVSDAMRDIEIREAEINDLMAEAELERAAETALSLAARLRPGQPCPVCGSNEHPAPARSPASAKFDAEDRIASAKRSLSDARNRHATLLAEAAGRAANLETAKERARLHREAFCSAAGLAPSCMAEAEVPSPEEGAERLKEASRRMQEASDAATRTQKALRELEELRKAKDRHERDLAKGREELAALEAVEASLASSIRDKTARYLAAFGESRAKGRSGTAAIDPSEAAEEIEIVNSRSLEIEATRSSHEAKREETMRSLSSLEGARAALAASIAQTAAELERAESAYARARETAGFADDAAVKGATMDDARAEAEVNAIAEWKRELDTARGTLAAVSADVDSWKGPDLSELERSLAANDEERETAEKARETALAEASRLDSLKTQHDGLEAERAERAARAGALGALAGDLTGANPSRVSFDAWILGMYLEEITKFANERLWRMSEGRYRIKLNDSYRKGNNLSGLDLEILDSYTGKSRPSGTLSGGETFMTSISLALGLADSIQSRTGGIQLDAVFIDEGFGSLDEASLERALSILDEIRGQRMVGIISHVPELKNRIPNRIEVVKQSAGSIIRKETLHA